MVVVAAAVISSFPDLSNLRHSGVCDNIVDRAYLTPLCRGVVFYLQIRLTPNLPEGLARVLAHVCHTLCEALVSKVLSTGSYDRRKCVGGEE